MTYAQAAVKYIEDTFPGACASTGYSEWYDLMYRVRFRNGTILENANANDLMREAFAYYHSTYKLTGEYP